MVRAISLASPVNRAKECHYRALQIDKWLEDIGEVLFAREGPSAQQESLDGEEKVLLRVHYDLKEHGWELLRSQLALSCDTLWDDFTLEEKIVVYKNIRQLYSQVKTNQSISTVGHFRSYVEDCVADQASPICLSMLERTSHLTSTLNRVLLVGTSNSNRRLVV